MEICKQPLREFSNNLDDNSGFARSRRPSAKYKVEREQMPAPYAIALTLRVLLQCGDLGRSEKLEWEYPFTYQGVECSISREKFGIRIYVGHSKEGPKVEAHKIARKIASAALMMEKNLLRLMAMEALKAGDVTIPNLYYKLRGMYEHFRSAAERAYAGEGVLARPMGANQDTTAHMTARSLKENIAARQEGLYATIAMVQSYFSLLEHVLVLSLPSNNFDPATEEVSSYIGLTLFEKYDRTFTKGKDKTAQKLRAKLKVVAETWRNPYSHGGFDKLHKGIGFHIADLGVLPIGLSSITNTPEFHLFPEKDQGFDDLCKAFDEIDEFLLKGPLWASMQWVMAGLDVPLDKESLTDFKRAITGGPESVSEHITYVSYQVDQAMNMDW